MDTSLFFSFFLLIALASGSSINVPAIFAFGDSILDAGNNHFNKNCTIQADFPPYGQNFFHHPTGRFTNGRTVMDFVCENLGIDLVKPYLEADLEVRNGSRKDYPANGINFASAGSGIMKETNANMGVIAIQTQLEQFEDLVNRQKIDKKTIQRAIFIFESGSNDIFNYFIPFRAPQLDSNAFIGAMLEEVELVVHRLYKMGARRFALLGLGPVGCIPARVILPGAPIHACHEQMNQMVLEMNSELEALVKVMPTKFPGAVGVYGATFDIVQHFRSLGKHYGFSNTTSACCGTGTLGGMVQCGTGEYSMCENPNEFLFWDYFHPTEHAYKLITKAFWAGKHPRIRPINLKTLASIINV